MSLCGVEVFPVAASAASSKQASASGGTGAYLVSDGADSVSSGASHGTHLSAETLLSDGPQCFVLLSV